MAQLLTSTVFRSTRLDGTPNALGQVFFYQAGTLVSQPTYTTEAGDVPNGNPVTLGADGTKAIYLDDGLSYRVVERTASGELIRDTDNLAGENLLQQLAAQGGASLIGYLPGGLGAVASSVQDKLRESASFKDFGAVGDGVTDDTASIQAAINATFGRLLGTPGATYNVNTTLQLHSNIDIDLQGSTVNWTGGVVNSLNKTLRWDNAVFRCGAIAPGPAFSNVKVRNGVINCNDWGCGVFFKRAEGCAVSEITVSTANAAGIALLDCTDFRVSGNRVLDCAANPAQEFGASTDLEAWSDGIFIFYGSQAGEVSNNTVINTRVGTGRGGIVIDDALAGSVESGRKTAAVTVRGNVVRGYDRQVHLEYVYAVSVIDNILEFVDSGTKTFNCAIVDWNNEDTVWQSNRCRSTKTLAMMSGSVNVLVSGGSLKKTGGDTASNAFSNQNADLVTVKFKSVDIDTRGSNSNLYRWDALFEDCTFTSLAGTVCDLYEGRYRFLRTTITNSRFNNRFGLSTDRLSIEDCPVVGFSGTSYFMSVPAGTASQLYLRRLVLEPGDVRCLCGTTAVVNDMEFNTLPIFDGSPLSVQLDGEFLMSSLPVSGTWTKGQKLRNTNPAPSTNYGWVVTTTGTFGAGDPVFKTYGAIQA